MARVVENLLLLVCARTREQDERKERSNADVESEKKAKGGCSEREHLSLSLLFYILIFYLIFLFYKNYFSWMLISRNSHKVLKKCRKNIKFLIEINLLNKIYDKNSS